MIFNQLPHRSERQRDKKLRRLFEWRVMIVAIVGMVLCLVIALVKELAK